MLYSTGLTPHKAAKDAYAHRCQQLWGMAFDEPGQAEIKFVDLPGELCDALGEPRRAQAGPLAVAQAGQSPGSSPA
ncbi:hypothetical protein SSP24_10920 [Streptomyces spinoverrucosus]|uniref:Uncharacterized protein n=2 Tax=Streptomyces spinoverrucosus TaxID=284043 RepID=A0A4Y3V8X7_9ACTN|nr:hypothetical protein SSP24_10920 [Streptomyces spinoverrucosus]GHB35662.1 hypothetical protein GCM10010397_01650 [Streptomyces spinoverrucosus]